MEKNFHLRVRSSGIRFMEAGSRWPGVDHRVEAPRSPEHHPWKRMYEQHLPRRWIEDLE